VTVVRVSVGSREHAGQLHGGGDSLLWWCSDGAAAGLAQGGTHDGERCGGGVVLTGVSGKLLWDPLQLVVEEYGVGEVPRRHRSPAMRGERSSGFATS
jgi:hypothetical protein